MRTHFISQGPRRPALAALSIAILTILSASAAWAGSPVNTGYFDKVAINGLRSGGLFH
jgi:hypothetical protein